MKDDQKYTEAGFWEKINTTAKKAGQEVVEKALQLYYTAESAETPRWMRVLIYGALAYLIAPLDAIPDFLPAGLTDDLGILAGTLSAVIAHITPEVKKRASEKLDEWFD
ncbi:MAG: DUF1232 domain-containing protein [Gemmatimonadetes bacterium]|nr:DUF1232 domain-containing protein [Gemmatimonadota bacterium]MYK51702.1 DUF1232 domain-containing protein [Gemmatimonadota bacterium]